MMLQTSLIPIKIDTTSGFNSKQSCSHRFFKSLTLSPLIPRFNIFKSDRKSTRLNSSHVSISYAVFCLKKKKKKKTENTLDDADKQTCAKTQRRPLSRA